MISRRTRKPNLAAIADMEHELGLEPVGSNPMHCVRCWFTWCDAHPDRDTPSFLDLPSDDRLISYEYR